MSTSGPGFQVVEAKWRSIGEGEVLRFLPMAKKRTVGPFVFVDHMGASKLSKVERPLVDVPPHPHIGLATVNYLFEGAIFHRDSIGSAERITPGAVNWMTSGRGIVHSERTPTELRHDPPPLFGVQSWVALPKGGEDVEPTFQHVPSADLPLLERDGVSVRLIAGTGFGMSSPVVVASPIWCAAVECRRSGRVLLPADHQERAFLLLDGAAEIQGEALRPGSMAVLPEGWEPVVSFSAPSRAFLIGGPPLPERRYLDWNFCSTQPERIEAAKELYRKGLLGEIPDEGANLPLPEDVG